MSNVGPIIFADETARAQLVTHGEVVTFRKSERTTGETWWRTSRTGPKEGDVLVEEIARGPPVQPVLQHRAHKSGFESWEAWQAAIEAVNGDLPGHGHLYRVTVIDDE